MEVPALQNYEVTRVYDKWKWHTDGEFPRDAKPSQGFVHIAGYLTWLILAGQENPEFFRMLEEMTGRPLRESIRSRKRTAMSLRDPLDGALVSDIMSAEAAAFSDTYYNNDLGEDDLYVQDWADEFGPVTNTYGVPDSWETYDRIVPRIEARFRDWQDRRGGQT